MHTARIAGLALALAAWGGAASAAPITLDFDELAAGTEVGSTYSLLGVAFEDALTSSNFGLAGSSGGIALTHASSGYRTTTSDPFVAYFDFDVDSVSITGIDIGARGFQISAYDDIDGGALIDREEVFGGDIGVGSYYTLTVEAAGIRRVEFSQAGVANSSDGAIYDDFVFVPGAPGVSAAGAPSTVPVPAALPLLAAALGGLGLFRLRRAKG